MTAEALTTNSWEPSASRQILQQRASLLRSIRHFFDERNVMEVETPILSHSSVTDPYLHCFETQLSEPGKDQTQTLFMMTSPEFHMKRLLAAGSGSIYQICKSFRNEESGKLHNPEFTMLEWYRLGFDHHALMDELELLIKLLLKLENCERISYQHAFIEQLGFDPLVCPNDVLKNAVKGLGLSALMLAECDRDDLLQLAFSAYIEPEISKNKPCFVYDFPASQASLARICPNDSRVASRFELYYKGVELANGFHELCDVVEQEQRFEKDRQKRKREGSIDRSVDPMLLDALKAGLPDCAGVALGLDRIFMLALGKERISEVIAFPQSNC
ncbi:elongation factor P--(R)-beta-lysine ligase [Alginatibacterium sediminis]|uniref:Elongation factor P--(R)-beta-lysine ligase n=1 Tax=Alginatibacterium sediminis TaxID=2164068 RepID=A0A420E7N7_9ALTE|nr:elongation factor P--(R)-beta-lysine ligase [Alginatibacterium sediminis]RKF14514.1 elongation factor P--(R)-beta-lysine ligase [Alginatibacterium sediminis]